MKDRVMTFIRTYWKLLAANAVLVLWLFLSLFLASGDIFRIALTLDLTVVLPLYPVAYGIVSRKIYDKIWMPPVLLLVTVWAFTVPFFRNDIVYSLFMPVFLYIVSTLSALITALTLALRRRQDKKDEELSLYHKDDPNFWKSMASIDAYEKTRNDQP